MFLSKAWCSWAHAGGQHAVAHEQSSVLRCCRRAHLLRQEALCAHEAVAEEGFAVLEGYGQHHAVAVQGMSAVARVGDVQAGPVAVVRAAQLWRNSSGHLHDIARQRVSMCQ